MWGFLIVLMFVFQLIVTAATASASMTDGHEHHHELADAASKCPMQAPKLDAGGHGEAEPDGTHQGTAHCMSSMCCLHDTVSSSPLVTIGALLPGTQMIDRGTALSSNTGSTQERPPRHV